LRNAARAALSVDRVRVERREQYVTPPRKKQRPLVELDRKHVGFSGTARGQRK
jgi:hypothetical protein